jgi:hypothetical protein
MPFLSRKLETRTLSTSDMKKIVRVLQGVPSGLFRKDDEEAYVKQAKETIKALPSRLRAATLFFHKSNLCHIHKGLDDYLINEIFAWIKHEFEGAIGKYIYPIIMSEILSPYEESLIRRLEPVSQMWRRDFDLALTPPPKRTPINAGTKWHFQGDQCPACMLARMGSDMDILGALFTGMVARSPNTQRSFFRPEEIRQKRLRFVRYWMKSHPCGEKEVPDKYQFGVYLKTLRPQAKKLIGDREKKFFYNRHSILPPVGTVNTGTSSSRGSRDRCPEERSARQQSGRSHNTSSPRNGLSSAANPSSPGPHMASRLSRPVDLPVSIYTGDYPAHAGLSPLVPTEPSRHAPGSRPTATTSGLQRVPRTQRSASGAIPTVSPPTSPRPAPSSVYSTASRLSANSTIASYDRAPPSVSDIYTPARPSPLDRWLNSQPMPSPSSPAGVTVWASEASELLAQVPSGQAHVEDLPMPRPQSMYGSFCDATFDGTEFDYANESPPASPIATAGEAMSEQFDRAVADRLAALELEEGKGAVAQMETLREEAPTRGDAVQRKETPRMEVPRAEVPRTNIPRPVAPRIEAPRTEAPRKVTRCKEPAPNEPWNPYFSKDQ